MALSELHRQMSRESREILIEILGDCGITVTDFDRESDAGLTPEELEERLGRIWVWHARCGGLEERWQLEIGKRQDDYDTKQAAAYAQVTDQMEARATETAKKNAIVLGSPEVTAAKEDLGNGNYAVAMIRVVRKALDTRMKGLQAIKGLKVSEIEHLHAHLRTDPS